jgi:hypothetical protein
MKKIILFLLVATTISANSQTLKEALYGGKLKKDSNTVIRKTDDLKTKIDTSTKKIDEIEKNKVTTTIKDPSANNTTDQPDPSVITSNDKSEVTNDAKDNNKLWKEFMNSFIETLNTEVLPNKKIKSGTYYILIDYEIGLEGQVTINNIYPSPENKFLEQQIKERLTLSAPQLNPVLLSTGKPRKAIKKYNFTLTKM